MKKTITIITVIFALNVSANNDINSFVQIKQKKMDSLYILHNKKILDAQKIYEKALIDADLLISSEISKIDREQEKIIEKLKELPKEEIVKDKKTTK